MTGRALTLWNLQSEFILSYPSHTHIHYWQKKYDMKSPHPVPTPPCRRGRDNYPVIYSWKWGQVGLMLLCIQLLPCVCFVIIHALEQITVHLWNHHESYALDSNRDRSRLTEGWGKLANDRLGIEWQDLKKVNKKRVYSDILQWS